MTNHVSFKHAEEASEAQVKAFEALTEKNGFGFGTLSVTIHEESDARETRDAAIVAASATLKVAEQSLEVEKKLRKQIAQLQDAFNKERQEHVETKLSMVREGIARDRKIEQLEAEVAKLKKSGPRNAKKR